MYLSFQNPGCERSWHRCGRSVPGSGASCCEERPAYRIEPPDILTIEAVNLVPTTPYKLRTFDSLVITVGGALPEAPIEGTFSVGSVTCFAH